MRYHDSNNLRFQNGKDLDVEILEFLVKGKLNGFLGVLDQWVQFSHIESFPFWNRKLFES